MSSMVGQSKVAVKKEGTPSQPLDCCKTESQIHLLRRRKGGAPVTPVIQICDALSPPSCRVQCHSSGCTGSCHVQALPTDTPEIRKSLRCSDGRLLREQASVSGRLASRLSKLQLPPPIPRTSEAAVVTSSGLHPATLPAPESW
ncbi:hypothetical protein NDU88_006197 [Pleurodeles waltl]|uniref:Uncharacterized protein n=1 Tax=Pleurodeles waltl TaxID=8319 RepID=A0AAV7RRB4_PLEWA|nr:hypothetical protein NDU88_006197 [Pleurodeles waltl]